MSNTLDLNNLKDKLLLPLAVPIVYASRPKYRARNLAISLVRWDTKQIFVFNLLRCTTEHDLRRIFSVYGRITKIDLMLSDFNEEAYNHAYITYYADIGARRAINSKYRLSNGPNLEKVAKKDPLVQNYLADKYTPSPPASIFGITPPSRYDNIYTPSPSTSTFTTTTLSSSDDEYYFTNSPRIHTIRITHRHFEDELYCNAISSDDSD